MDWRESDDGVRWLEAELPGARAAFSTRLGGVSAAPFDALNLGILTDDEPAAVYENRSRLATALGHAPDRIAFGLQVHGAKLARHSELPRCAFFPVSGSKAHRDVEPPEVDGQVIAMPGLAGLVFVADCLPVALAGPGGVAMLHCGWRPLAAGIIAKGAAAIGATAAAIGPGIGPCCYEVGDEVLSAFADLGEGVADGQMLDLPEVARRSLAGVGVEQVEAAGLCTSCEPGLFFSHRRDAGITGRQAGLAWIDPGGIGELA
jgi:YfiH family protein